MWEKSECPLSQSFMDDMKAIDSVEPQAQTIPVPWLFVHGSADTVVPIEESERLYQQEAPHRTLVNIPDADHVFSEPHAAIMADQVVDWLLDDLNT